MKTAAIIAEYNPFHNGHLWQLSEIKKSLGADFCIVIMSGNYVQRGAPAIIDKFTRARWALLHGADMILELPIYSATAGAEQFASGACRLLNDLGGIHALCFGCENAEPELISKIAAILAEPETIQEMDDTIHNLVCKGVSYASAREQAFYPFLEKYHLFHGNQEQFHCFFSSPNNILAIEYYKALIKQNSSIHPCPMVRLGNGYHNLNFSTNNVHGIQTASATAIRTSLYNHCQENMELLPHFMPKEAARYLLNHPWIHENDFSLCLYYALLGKTAKELSCYYEVSPDLANRICTLFPKFTDLSLFTALLKSKQYTYNRISRCLFHILLSITWNDMKTPASYVRLLGLKKKASHLLKKTAERPVTILSKAANAKTQLTPEQYRLFEKDTQASQLYGYIMGKKQNTPYHELACSPIII